MRRLVLVHRAGALDPERREVAGPCSAGGSRGDAVLLDGVAPGALRLDPCAAGLLVEAASTGVRAAGHALLPGARRLLRAGERVVVRGHALALPAEEAPAGATAGSTRVIASDLLRRASDGAAPGPHLLVLTGPGAGQRLPLGPEQTLGRSRRATLRLADPRASRLHARLRLDGAGATVEDLGARNGLKVNGVPVEGRAQPLLPGDVLGIGETELALVVPWAGGAGAAAPGALPGVAATAPETGSPGADLRRAAAALLALAALALALAGA